MPPRRTTTPKPTTPKPTTPKPAPTTLILLVRHGRTPTTGSVLPGRARGLHLSDDGRRQAEAVAERLGALEKVDAVYASPLERARETAAPIAKRFGLPVKIERGLLECDFGAWTGGKLKVLARKPEWRTVQRWPSGFRFPDGESFVEMHSRITETLQRLAAAHRGGRIVAVSHADPIKAAVADAAGSHLDQFQRIVVSPCSVSALLYGPGGPTVLCVNSLGDLKELAPS